MPDGPAPAAPLVIAIDDPAADDVRAVLATHLAFAHEVTPTDHVHALDVEALLDPAVTFFSVRRHGEVLGVGALRQLDPTHVEIKSMHVGASRRGQGIGLALVQHLIEVARQRGCARVSLETGTGEVFAPAHALYTKVGFRPCRPFGAYTDNAYSVCMAMDIARRST